MNPMEDDVKYILLVRTGCSYCLKAVDLLESKELDHKLIVSRKSNLIFKSLKEIFGWETVPMIFAKKGSTLTFIGGYTDLIGRISD